MATVNSANAVSTQTINQQNPYLAMSQTSMANDFFGAQAFGTASLFSQNYNAAPQISNAGLGEGSGTLASAILQNYYATQNSNRYVAMQGVNPSANYRTPTVEDYCKATQIANMFANNTPLINPNTSFFEKDMFAQQLINPAYNAKLSYSA